MNRAVRRLCFICLSAALAGCGGRDYSGEQRFPLSGKVTYDGQPIDRGSISFIPQGDTKKQRVSGGLIENGTYSVPEAKGANAGTYRVEIRWAKSTGKKIHIELSGEILDEFKEGLPPKFHKESEMTVEVSEEQTVFDFDLKSE